MVCKLHTLAIDTDVVLCCSCLGSHIHTIYLSASGGTSCVGKIHPLDDRVEVLGSHTGMLHFCILGEGGGFPIYLSDNVRGVVVSLVGNSR